MGKMAFNADAYLEAMESPTITIDGVEYVAKHLSFNDALRFQSRFDTGLDADSIPVFVKELCEAVNLPADKILGLPPVVFHRVLEGFLAPLLTGVSPAE